jgi:hypothetical protein
MVLGMGLRGCSRRKFTSAKSKTAPFKNRRDPAPSSAVPGVTDVGCGAEGRATRHPQVWSAPLLTWGVVWKGRPPAQKSTAPRKPSLVEEACESWEYAFIDEFPYLCESSDLLGDSRFVAAEHYRKGVGIIIVEFVLKCERSAHYKPVVRSIDGHNASCKLFACKVRKMQDCRASISRNPSVLVEVTHLIEPPQRVRFIGCPSMIWLKKFDFADGFFRNSGETTVEGSQFIPSQNWAIDNRECGALWNSAQSGQAPHQLVKRGTHVIDRVACNQANMSRNIEELKAKDVASIFKVVLTANCIGIRGELGYGSVESIKVICRPNEFGVRIFHSGHAASISREAW